MRLFNHQRTLEIIQIFVKGRNILGHVAFYAGLTFAILLFEIEKLNHYIDFNADTLGENDEVAKK